MGLTGSPYTCFQGAVRGKSFTLGDRKDRENPFHWERVVLTNVPGLWDYDPSRPRVYKVRWDRRIAGDLVIYIDDVRAVSFTHAAAW
jgi:hypothetical protein